MRKVLILSILSILCMQSPSIAGPFGVEMGQKLDELTVLGEARKGLFGIEPKQTHEEFEEYAVVYAPEAGVCGLSLFGVTHEDDRFGSNVRNMFKEISDTITKAYGEGIHVDYMEPDGIWTEDNEWVASINKNERTYGSIWSEDEGLILNNNINKIGLMIKTLGFDKSFLLLEYHFKNYNECIEEIKKETDSVF